MNKILLVSDSAPIHPRLNKIGSLFSNHKVSALMWDRSGFYKETEVCENDFVFESNIGYGNRFKILIELPLLIIYIMKVLKSYKPDIVVARYFTVAFIMSVVAPKKVKLYYDVSDMPIYYGKVLNKLIGRLEKRVLKRSYKVILSSRFFKEFYSNYEDKIIVLENKVDKESFSKVENEPKSFVKDDGLVINFIGKVRYFEIIQNVILGCKDLHVTLNFYGDGSDLEKCRSYVKDNNFSNVNFYGRYNYSDIMKFYSEADLILCAYPSKDLNVKYSIANKFFECLYFEKPIIVSKGTKLGEIVNANNLGVSVDCYSVKDIKNTLLECVNNKEKLVNIKQSIATYSETEMICWESYPNFM